IQELLKDNRLSAKLEDNVLILKLIKCDLKERKPYLTELMRYVRLSFVRTEFLRGHVDRGSPLRKHPKCYEFLIQAVQYHRTPKCKRLSFSCQNIAVNRNEEFYVLLPGGGVVET
uniref:BACK domain-containing protein n=1 Tax=Glossina brevipalpis TaxID=37001 RepID=A0A1A9VZH7_9MUSC